jgi:hypothetical protein
MAVCLDAFQDHSRDANPRPHAFKNVGISLGHAIAKDRLTVRRAPINFLLFCDNRQLGAASNTAVIAREVTPCIPTVNDSSEVNSILHAANCDSPVTIPWPEYPCLSQLPNDHARRARLIVSSQLISAPESK